MNKIAIDESQALWFRMRRHFLTGAGAGDVCEVARAVLGFQAQQEGPALLGLSQRLAARPTAAALLPHLREQGRCLVWTWGQRGTLHFYDAENDWVTMSYARSQWTGSRERIGIPSEAVLNQSWEVLQEKGDLFTKDDLEGVLPEAYLEEIRDYADKAKMTPQRLGATRVMWRLTQQGHLCLAGKKGAERLYARREAWFPKVLWPEKGNALELATHLAKRYLAAFAPATPADIASYFGAKVSDVKKWLKTIPEELVEIDCGGRRGLLALAEDVASLQETPPDGSTWPLRMLPLWDGLLIGHKDKTWMVPDPTENKKVWRPGLYVSATVIVRGRIAATWRHKVKRKKLQITLQPLTRWMKDYDSELYSEATKVASHLGLEECQIQVEKKG